MAKKIFVNECQRVILLFFLQCVQLGKVSLSNRFGHFLSKKNGPFISKCYLVFFLGGSDFSENTKQQNLPSFKSRAKVYKAEIGETTVLLCKVNNLGELLLNLF